MFAFTLLIGCSAPEPTVSPDPRPATEVPTAPTPPPVIDTGHTGGPRPPLGYVTYAGSGVADPGHTYTGGEFYAIRQFHDQVVPAFEQYDTVCEIQWEVLGSEPPPFHPCEGCTFAFTMERTEARETTPAGLCDNYFDVADVVENRWYFEIGYHPAYEWIGPGGSTYGPALMVFDSLEWVAVTDQVRYDPATHAFDYNWIQGTYYL